MAANEATTDLDLQPIPRYDNPFDREERQFEATLRANPAQLTEVPQSDAEVSNESLPDNEPSTPTQLPPGATPEAPAPAPDKPLQAPSQPEAPPATPAVEPPPPAAPAVETPAVEAPPAQQTAAERLAYQLKREADRKAKDAIEELQRERHRVQQLELDRAAERALLQRQQTPAYEAPETYEQDPLTVMQQQMAQLQQQLQVQALETEITQQVSQFESRHPDFNQALSHYIEAEIQTAEEDGTLADTIGRIRGMQQGNEMIRTVAMQNNTTEADAARNLAIATIYQQRRQQMAMAAKRSGKNIGELVYNRAQRYGYNPASMTPAEPTVPREASAAEQVRQEQAAAAASSISNIPRQTTTPRAKEYSYDDLQVLMKSDPGAFQNYVAEMDAKDPRWMEKLG